MALLKRTAVTEESTPPLMATITLIAKSDPLSVIIRYDPSPPQLEKLCENREFSEASDWNKQQRNIGGALGPEGPSLKGRHTSNNK